MIDNTLLDVIKGKIKFDAKLDTYTRFKVGGKADILFIPNSEDDLIIFLKNKPKDMPITILGLGSNVLIRDGGIKGAVIKFVSTPPIINPSNNLQIIANTGSTAFSISKLAFDNSIGGLEFLSGIPGTIGGMLTMNAGANGREVKDIFVSAKALDYDGNIHTFNKLDMGFSYRKSIKQDYIFLSAILEGYADDINIIEKKMNEIKLHRETKQPYNSQTAGSTFKNPKEMSAWEAIKKAGCSDLKVGGAAVSSLHANFIINTGNAKATDIEELIELIEHKVKEKLGITLEREIKIIGEKNE